MYIYQHNKINVSWGGEQLFLPHLVYSYRHVCIIIVADAIDQSNKKKGKKKEDQLVNS